MKKIETEVVSLVHQLARTIKKVGVRKVAEVLNKINEEKEASFFNKSVIDYTINEVCSEFSVPKTYIKRKNIRGNIIEARRMCFIILKKHLDLRHNEIAGVFGLSNHTLVSVAIKDFKKLDAQIKRDREFLHKYMVVDAKVKGYKEKLYLTQKHD
jgi:chromosomal replication initiation ATPase DnaA